VVFLSATRIRARTPVLTSSTGFGNAGPAQVQVRSGGRTSNAGTFTFTFRVLAFGDSLTWGTTCTFVTRDPSTRFCAAVDRPYPRSVKNMLMADPRFGSFVRVTNAGVPGEQVTAGLLTGEVRLPRCLATDSGPGCFADPRDTGQQPDPNDFVRPFDVVVILEGINDLINEQSPQQVQAGLRRMVIAARANNVPVLMTRFESFAPRFDGFVWPGLSAVPQLNTLIWALTEEQALQRLGFEGISMSQDGLHPNVMGYDRMAQLVVAKLLEMFPAGTTATP
jgi:lysophospholipase L1-like esterase